MTEHTFSADPSAYRVHYDRAPDAQGRLVCISIWERCAETGGDREQLEAYRESDGEMERIIKAAEQEESYNPWDGQLPADRSIICAALRDCGIDPAGEGDPEPGEPDCSGIEGSVPDGTEDEEVDGRDVLERLADAQLGLSGIGEVVPDTAIQAIADAHDEIARLRALVRDAVEAWPAFDANPADDCEVNGGDLVEWFGAWRTRAKAALAGTALRAPVRFLRVVINDAYPGEILEPHDVHAEAEEEREQLAALVRGEVLEVTWGGGAAPMVVITPA